MKRILGPPIVFIYHKNSSNIFAHWYLYHKKNTILTNIPLNVHSHYTSSVPFLYSSVEKEYETYTRIKPDVLALPHIKPNSEKYSELMFIKTAMTKNGNKSMSWTDTDHSRWSSKIGLHFRNAKAQRKTAINIQFHWKEMRRLAHMRKANQYFRFVWGVVNKSICSRSLWIMLNMQRGETERNFVTFFYCTRRTFVVTIRADRRGW